MTNKPVVPTHVAVIMDGNGRWAKKRNLPRSAGHKEGREALKRTIEAGLVLGIRAMTFYCFSTENWSRPQDEIDELMNLLSRALESDFSKQDEKGVRIRFAGDMSRFPKDIRQKCFELEQKIPNPVKMDVVLAMNYGGRAEIVRATQKIAEQVQKGELSLSEITQDKLSSFMYHADVPFPDLLIRTSGEKRISNFLLWQCAYSEFYFTDVLWPDFNEKHLRTALSDFALRQRRFGGI